MKNVKFASISDQLINTAIIMDMMFNTEVIVKDMKGGKGDMTEKYCNRDCIHFESDYHWYGNEEWEEVNCELGHSEIHDTAYFTYCEDYDDEGKYDN